MVRTQSVSAPVGLSSGIGGVIGLNIIGNNERKRVRLTKKTNVKKGSGLILGSSQFPNVGRVAF